MRHRPMTLRAFLSPLYHRPFLELIPHQVQHPRVYEIILSKIIGFHSPISCLVHTGFAHQLTGFTSVVHSYLVDDWNFEGLRLLNFLHVDVAAAHHHFD